MEAATFSCLETEGSFCVTEDIKEAFREYGFIVIRKLFSEEEMKLLCQCFENQEFRNKMFTRSNGEKNGFQMALWWEPGDDTAGVMSRCKRVVETMMDLLGGKELYLLSSKLIAKDPEVGGAFAWHQDYGYFYENGVLYPDCGSVSIPLHKCYKENGCLQVIPRSHKLGRLNHSRAGDLASVDGDRLEAITNILGEPIMIQTMPGDVLFFHSNLLHTSGPNTSKDKRWNLVLAYNQVENAPYHDKFLPAPKKLIIAEDEDVIKSGQTSSSNKIFIENNEDNSTEQLST